jgi:hypothetical protein
VDVVTSGGSKVERRDPIGPANFDNPECIVHVAKLIAELLFVTIKRDRLVAQNRLTVISFPVGGCASLVVTAATCSSLLACRVVSKRSSAGSRITLKDSSLAYS